MVRAWRLPAGGRVTRDSPGGAGRNEASRRGNQGWWRRVRPMHAGCASASVSSRSPISGKT
jgi:hypothetical protein